MSRVSNHQPEVIDEVNGRRWQELLPPTKSEPKGFLIEFTPTADLEGPRAGVLAIFGKRDFCRYTVNEFPSDWAGRAFMLFKLDEGKDKAEERYACFVGRAGEQTCECKGFQYTRSCKHLTAIATLIENGKL